MDRRRGNHAGQWSGAAPATKDKIDAKIKLTEPQHCEKCETAALSAMQHICSSRPMAVCCNSRSTK